ncbi:MAG TPA: HEAT repeat domain-containing protein, partial [Planctomycetota bacterium]|nr:HEAT repeat domain-containing protein [Planctomycetota bacterium]
MMTALWTAALLLGAQDPPPGLSELLEALRSDRIDERETAAEEIRKQSASAVPFLERAARSEDPEFSARAREILRAIQISSVATQKLAQAVPRVLTRRFREDPAEWIAALEETRPHPELRPEDLEGLVRLAWSGAVNQVDRLRVFNSISWRQGRFVSEVLSDMMKDECEEIRILAAQQAGGANGQILLPNLLELARGDRPGPRQAALEALRRLRPNTIAPSVVALLGDPAPGVRGELVPVLRSLDREKLVPLLVPYLSDPRSDVRWIAASVLGELRVEAAVAELRLRLGDGNPKIRLRAVQVLGQWKVGRFLEDLLPLLHDSDPDVAALAIGAVSRPEHAGPVVPELLRVVHETRAVPRRVALHALVRLGNMAALPELVKDLHVPEDRWEAIRGLLTLRAERAIPDLERCLDQKESRGDVALALGLLGSKDSLPKIRQALDDPDFLVRHRVVHALWLLEDRECGRLLVEHLAEVPEVSRCAGLMMIDLETPGVLPRLAEIAGAKDPVAGTDVGAVQILGHLGNASHRDLFRGLLGDPRAPMRHAAAQALGRLGEREGIPTLVRLLGDESPWLRSSVLRTLGRMGAKEATSEMLRFVAGRGPDQLEALSALISLRAPEAAGPAWKILSEAGPSELRAEAARAVSILEGKEAESRLRGLVSDLNPLVGYEAATGFCRRGTPRGVSRLLERVHQMPDGPLFALNALRES